MTRKTYTLNERIAVCDALNVLAHKINKDALESLKTCIADIGHSLDIWISWYEDKGKFDLNISDKCCFDYDLSESLKSLVKEAHE